MTTTTKTHSEIQQKIADAAEAVEHVIKMGSRSKKPEPYRELDFALGLLKRRLRHPWAMTRKADRTKQALQRARRAADAANKAAHMSRRGSTTSVEAWKLLDLCCTIYNATLLFNLERGKTAETA